MYIKVRGRDKYLDFLRNVPAHVGLAVLAGYLFKILLDVGLTRPGVTMSFVLVAISCTIAVTANFAQFFESVMNDLASDSIFGKRMRRIMRLQGSGTLCCRRMLISLWRVRAALTVEIYVFTIVLEICIIGWTVGFAVFYKHTQ